MDTDLRSFLKPARLTEVVDVGANPIDGDPPYRAMLNAGLCNVVGFEPQAPAFDMLQANKGPHERYLPVVVGDGESHVLNIYRADGLTSLLELDPWTVAMFEDLVVGSELIKRTPVHTTKLDDISDLQVLDFLKIDIQGSELAVFRGGRKKLAKTVFIQTEVSFVPLYMDQPPLGEVDLELRRQGFIPHCIAAVKGWPISPITFKNQRHTPLNQVVEADIVYVRDFTRLELLDEEQLKHMALIADHCYGSFDLAARCIRELEERGALEAGTAEAYFERARAQHLADPPALPDG